MKLLPFATYVTEADEYASLPWIDGKETAQLIRAALKKYFPSTKFSVTSSGEVRIKWTDGPTGWQVEQVCAPFQGRGFDGMDDSNYVKKNIVTRADGSKARAAFVFVFTSREISAAVYTKVLSVLDKKGFAWASDGTVEIKTESWGHAYPKVDYTKAAQHRSKGWDVQSIEQTIRKYAINMQGNGILAVKKGERL